MKNIVFLFLVILSSCSNRNEFCKLNDLTYEDEYVLHELYVMTAPSDNLDSLAFQILYYVDSKSIGYGKNYSSHFYKETRDTPRDYKEDHSFISDVIADHLDDLIAVAKKDEHNNWSLKIKTHNNPDEWIAYKTDMLNK
ncbi:hypothetical protein BZG02_13580 [Labilibaculum filiforme]|uniref:Uncharacterized protein n=1 Tax=Labilibaculum filiforme TaxID=1940526 RepID=A0A2N3HV64_9BACT|nr:hypothetical protein [Labilibaculum filiforme]PKQ61966.1 hypothetical protein BZG02_13580 [Labilibaculum filiforme]